MMHGMRTARCFALGTIVVCFSGDEVDHRAVGRDITVCPTQRSQAEESAEARAIVNGLELLLGRVELDNGLRRKPSNAPVALLPRIDAAVSTGGTVAFLGAELSALAPRRHAVAALPATADAPFSLTDVDSGLGIRVRIVDAGPAAVETVRGHAVYPRAVSEQGHLVHRATSEGTEDWVVFVEPPATNRVSYELDLGEAAAGLRLVANTLEVLDKGGAPRLRVAPPWLVDSAGRPHEARLAVRGCAADRSPASPWGRPPTPPGAPRCVTDVEWDGSDVVYPAVLDPYWASAGHLAVPRENHTATVIVGGGADGKVLVVGGRCSPFLDSSCLASHFGNLASAELYDPVTGTWSATSSLAEPRHDHRATLVGSGTSVLVTGGQRTLPGDLVYPTEVQAYDSETGLWSDRASMPAGRVGHTATLVDGGNVLVAGGYNGSSTFNSALVYEFKSNLWTSAGAMHEARAYHSATELESGAVLVVGGGSSPATEEYEPIARAWTRKGDLDARRGHTATRLAGGQVLVAGGLGIHGSTNDAALYQEGVWTATKAMGAARTLHTATLLESGPAAGKVLVVGGTAAVDSLPLATAELFDPAKHEWTGGESMHLGRHSHAAALLMNGAVLVVGGRADNGQGESSTTAGCELFRPSPPGAACVSAADCPGSQCIDGVCCESVCGGGSVDDCRACSIAAGSSIDGECQPLGETHSCPIINGSGVCTSGECSVSACLPGFGDCDTDPSNGCETALTGPAHCGECGKTCFGNSHMTDVSCTNGKCEGTCLTGWADCNGDKDADGCEANLAYNLDNCGSCGAACSNNHVSGAASCVGGKCVIPSCMPNWGDCNIDPNDGCEKGLMDDPSHCGNCNVACSINHIPQPTCLYGKCQGECDSGWVDCNSDKLGDGCEAPEVDNCGGCGGGFYSCSLQNIVRHCTAGDCDGTCLDGFGDCNGNKRKDGCETQISVDVLNCGQCNHECSQTTLDGFACLAGKCTGSCKPGLADCNDDKHKDGCETILGSDPDNCGACGASCSGNHVAFRSCVNGSCTGRCADGYADCNGDLRSDGCEKAASDADFCAVCASACNDGTACTNDTCLPGTGCVHVPINLCGNGKCDYGEDPCPAHCQPGCPSGCAADCADSDGDGLSDTWEAGGIDADCDGSTTGPGDLDLASLGAKIGVKDLFLELDYMVAPDHLDKPTDAEIQTLVAPFEAQGMKLHVLIDEALPHHDVVYVGTADQFAQCNFSDAVRFSEVRNAHMNPARRGVFRYALAAHSYAWLADCTPVNVGGLAIAPVGFVVVKGEKLSFAPPLPGVPLLHELGHTLGLGHGGSDDILYKPNYFSAMNVGGGWLAGGLADDFSRHKLPTLDENHLQEPIGIQSPEPAYVKWSCPQMCVSSVECAKPPYTGCQGTCANQECVCQKVMFTGVPITTQPVDWDCNGVSNGLNVAFNLNHLSPNSDTVLTPLEGYDDWSNLDYSMCGAGYGAFPLAYSIPADEERLWSDSARLTGSGPIRVTLTVFPEVFRLGAPGTVNVGVLSAQGFDATRVAPESLSFAMSTAQSVEAMDLDGDGLTDIDCEFAVDNLHLVPASVTATLTGALTSGELIQGQHAITALPPLQSGTPVARCANVVVEAGDACKSNASVNVGSHDQDGDILLLTQTPNGPYPLGKSTVALTVTDGSHASSCEGSVTVVDRSPPSMRCPQRQWLECDALGAVVEPNISATATDNCAVPNVGCAPEFSSSFPLGDTVVQCDSIDATGNRSDCRTLVTVTDTTPPVVSLRNGSHLFLQEPPLLDLQDALQGPDKQDFAFPFTLEQCVTSVVDKCFGPLAIEESAKITRVEWWPRSPTATPVPGFHYGVLHSRLTQFGNHGCDKFALTGTTSVNLPVVDLQKGGGSYYAVYFSLADRLGNTAQASCQVEILGTQSDVGKPLGVPLGCGVCVGEGCGSCPSPAQVCP